MRVILTSFIILLTLQISAQIKVSEYQRTKKINDSSLFEISYYEQGKYHTRSITYKELKSILEDEIINNYLIYVLFVLIVFAIIVSVIVTIRKRICIEKCENYNNTFFEPSYEKYD